MAKREPLGIRKIEALHYYVHDLERTRRFFVDKLDFRELGASSPELEREGRQRAVAFQAGQATFVIHQPIGEGGRAWRYLRKHPEGVGTVVFEVEEIDRAFRLLDERGGTFITDVQRFAAHGSNADGDGDGGRWRCSRSPRRSATPPSASSNGAGTRRCSPASSRRRAPPAGAASQSIRLHPYRSPDVELPDHEAGAALDGARAGLRADLADRVPHQRRRGGAEARARVGLEVGGDGRSPLRASSSPTTSPSARSSRNRRSTSSPRTTAATASSTPRWR